MTRPRTAEPYTSANIMRGLNATERDSLIQISIGGNGNAAWRPKTIAKLIARGLIVENGQECICNDRFGKVFAPIYSVPIPVHMAVCQWCSDNCPEET